MLVVAPYVVMERMLSTPLRHAALAMRGKLPACPEPAEWGPELTTWERPSMTFVLSLISKNESKLASKTASDWQPNWFVILMPFTPSFSSRWINLFYSFRKRFATPYGMTNMRLRMTTGKTITITPVANNSGTIVQLNVRPFDCISECA